MIYTNVYENSSIKREVEEFKRKLENRQNITINKARLMTGSEAETFKNLNNKAKIIYYGLKGIGWTYNEEKTNNNYWLCTPDISNNNNVYYVYGVWDKPDMTAVLSKSVSTYSKLRPIIVINKSELPQK